MCDSPALFTRTPANKPQFKAHGLSTITPRHSERFELHHKQVRSKVRVYKLADRHGAPRPPMTDVGTETAFRLEKAQAFPKK